MCTMSYRTRAQCFFTCQGVTIRADHLAAVFKDFLRGISGKPVFIINIKTGKTKNKV